MGVEPVFSSGDDLEERFRLGITLKFCLTFTLLNPEDGVVRIAIDDLVVQTLIPAKGEGMDDGQKFPDIVGAMDRTIVEYTIARLQVDGLIFHRTRIATAGCIHSPSVSPYFQRQWKYGIMTICRGI